MTIVMPNALTKEGYIPVFLLSFSTAPQKKLESFHSNPPGEERKQKPALEQIPGSSRAATQSVDYD